MAYDFNFEVLGYNFRFVNLGEWAFGIIVPPDANLNDEGYLVALEEAQNYCIPLRLEMELEEAASYWYKDISYRQFVDIPDIVDKIHQFKQQEWLVVHDWVGKLLNDILTNNPPLQRPSEQKPKKDQSGYVYLLKSDNGHHKIGKAKNPEDRLKTFTVKLPFHVEYICTIKTNDMRVLEETLHERFANKRIDGEWFNLETEDIEYIKGLAS